MISYFLDKAREAEPDLDLDPSDFAYPGPKPQSRETAVVMLADAIESATRVLQDPTPDRIRVYDRPAGEQRGSRKTSSISAPSLCGIWKSRRPNSRAS